MCSIAETSSPRGSRVRQVARAVSRSLVANASADDRSSNGTSARHIAGRRRSTRSVTSVITPSVPSDPMKRSIRSMSGAAKYPADTFLTRGIRYVGTGILAVRSDSTTSKNPSRLAVVFPRSTSSTSPLASTTVNARTQSRVVPYLNVAAPAALVATMPPTKAPAKVGTGG